MIPWINAAKKRPRLYKIVKFLKLIVFLIWSFPLGEVLHLYKILMLNSVIIKKKAMNIWEISPIWGSFWSQLYLGFSVRKASYFERGNSGNKKKCRVCKVCQYELCIWKGWTGLIYRICRCQSFQFIRSSYIWTFSTWPGHGFSETYHNFMFLVILGEVFFKNSEWELFKIISKGDFYT